MEELALCRICLAKDVGMRWIANTHLQEVYEGLTLMPLETKDGRPIQVCYICWASLQNCHQLKQRCLQSEELLTQVLNTDVIQLSDIKASSCSQRLSIVHPVVHLSMDGAALSDSDDDGVGDWDDSFHTTDAADDDQEEKKEVKDVDIEIKLEDSTLEENPAVPTSVSAESFCPKNVNIVLERANLNDRRFSTSVINQRRVSSRPEMKSEKTETTLNKLNRNERVKTELLDLESEDKQRFITKPVVISKIHDTEDKIDTTLDKHNEATEVYDKNEPTSKSDINKGVISQEKLSQTRKKPREKPFPCNVCKKAHPSIGSLKLHIRKEHAVKPYKCDLCNKKYKFKGLLKTHMTTKHKGVKQFMCDECNRGFFFKDNLTNHTCIAIEKRVMCDVCKVFISRRYLSQHMLLHNNENRVMCGVCKVFFSRGYLTRHMRIHNNDKRYMCEVCSKCFTRSYSLLVHMRIHTGEKPYMCELCKKCFIKKNRLVRHIRITHNGEKPYMCDLCKRCFGSSSKLKRHGRLHSGEKPFVCKECGKQFIQKSNMQSHMRTHTGEKPYSCNECNMCFTNHSSLKTHINKHHKIK